MTEIAQTQKGKFRYFMEQTGQLLVALLVVFAIRSSLVEPFKIPSGSMYPTLYVGDFIFVNKFAYGFKLPFSDLFGKPKVLVDRAPPKRGDIIVFLYPRDPSVHYIKRVIGLPGDTVELKEKIIYINNQPQPATEVDAALKDSTIDDIHDERYGKDHMRMFHEQLGDKKHLMMIDLHNDYNNHFGPITVPEGHIFVMGDNRDFSNDSRFWGFVPFENIAGKAEVIWLSLWINFKDFDHSSFKPGRIGTVLK